MDILVNIFILLLIILIIMGLIVGATIKINSLMTGKIFNLLSNKALFYKVASIIAIALSSIYFLSIIASDFYWADLFWFIYYIGLIFAVANYAPGIVTHLIKIHQNNLEDAKEQELREVE